MVVGVVVVAVVVRMFICVAADNNAPTAAECCDV